MYYIIKHGYSNRYFYYYFNFIKYIIMWKRKRVDMLVCQWIFLTLKIPLNVYISVKMNSYDNYHEHLQSQIIF